MAYCGEMRLRLFWFQIQISQISWFTKFTEQQQKSHIFFCIVIFNFLFLLGLLPHRSLRCHIPFTAQTWFLPTAQCKSRLSLTVRTGFSRPGRRGHECNKGSPQPVPWNSNHLLWRNSCSLPDIKNYYLPSAFYKEKKAHERLFSDSRM